MNEQYRAPPTRGPSLQRRAAAVGFRPPRRAPDAAPAHRCSPESGPGAGDPGGPRAPPTRAPGFRRRDRLSFLHFRAPASHGRVPEAKATPPVRARLTTLGAFEWPFARLVGRLCKARCPTLGGQTCHCDRRGAAPQEPRWREGRACPRHAPPTQRSCARTTGTGAGRWSARGRRAPIAAGQRRSCARCPRLQAAYLPRPPAPFAPRMMGNRHCGTR